LAVLAGAVAGHAPARTVDATELLDVDVQQLAGVAALVAVGRLKRVKSAELAQADALEDRRDGRQRHAQALGDLARGHPQPAQ
jgi:hypothetical protein